MPPSRRDTPARRPLFRTICHRILIGLWIGWGTIPAARTSAAEAPGAVPALTNVLAVRELTREQAETGPRVHVRAVITAVSSEFGLLFVEDDTAGIYVHLGTVNSEYRAGDELELQGIANAGRLTPVILAERVETRRRGVALPPAPAVPLAELWSGLWDSRRVRIRVHVTEDRVTPGYRQLAAVAGRRPLAVHLLDTRTNALASLAGSEIEIAGALANQVDDRRRIRSAALFVPTLDLVRILRQPAAVAESAPALPLNRLRDTLDPVLEGPIRIRGTVTLVRDHEFWIQDRGAGVRCVSPAAAAPQLGNQLDLLGHALLEGPSAWFATTRELAREPGPPATPVSISARDFSNWNFDGRLVELDASFVHRISRPEIEDLIFNAGDRTFDVPCPTPLGGKPLPHEVPGAVMNVTGVLRLQAAEDTTTPLMTVLARGVEDLRHVAPPPWPVRRTLGLVSALLFALLLGLIALGTSHRRLKEAHVQVRSANDTVSELNRDLENRVRLRTMELERVNLRLVEENRERRLAEQELADRETRLRDSQALAHVGNFAWIKSTDQVVWSDELFRIFGRAPGSCAPTHAAFLGHIHPDDRPGVDVRLRIALHDGQPVEAEYRIVRPSGEVRWVAAHVRAILDPAERPVGLEGTCQDITGRRELEAQLVQARKMEAIGTLAGGIAHEFNNILAAMLGHADLARRHSTYNAQALENLGEVLRAGQQARALISQMLTFSRPRDPERVTVLLPQIVEETLRLLRAALPETVEFRTSFAPGTPPVQADPGQLQQVLLNLVTNSAQALPNGRGWIEVAVDAPNLEPAKVARLRWRNGVRAVRLSVADNGAGIATADLPRIFEPFFTTKPAGQGTGLGLAVVHGIVGAHGGMIDVESEPGVGTRFSVLLAASDMPAPAPAPSPQPDATPVRPSGNPRVLFVDDEPALTSAAARVLDRAGYRVTATLDPLEALELFRLDPDGFDVVISDVSMPNKNGFELGRELLQLRPDVPIVLCTGFTAALSRHEALQAGMADLLYKPIDAATLETAVREALNRNRPAVVTPTAPA